MLLIDSQTATELATDDPRPFSTHQVGATIDRRPVLVVSGTGVLRYLVLTTLILLALHLLVVVSYQVGFSFPESMKFYFDREGNLPSYFSAIILLFASTILVFIAILKRRDKDSFSSQWAFLAILFLALSVDEAVSFHEILIEPLRKAYQLSGVLRFPWVIVGGAFVGIFCIAYLRFLLSLSRLMQRLFLLSGAIYIGGVLGCEMLSGYLFIGYDNFSENSLPYMLAMTLEETLEMSGILLFIHTLLRYVKAYSPQLTLKLR